MRHSATQGEKMKKSGIFCRKHYRRIVEHIPVIVPITVKYELNRTVRKKMLEHGNEEERIDCIIVKFQ